MTIKVVEPGLFTTVQDMGRTGYQKDGVTVSGAMDPYAMRIANLLVGNDENEAVLEMTLIGPTLQFEADALISITGGDFTPTIDEKPVKRWRPILVKRGARLRFRTSIKGCRAFLAVAGGIHVPNVLGSKSTYIQAQIGGYRGRALETNDLLTIGEKTDIAARLVKELSEELEKAAFVSSSWSISTKDLPDVDGLMLLRVVPGSDHDAFTQASIDHFFHQSFRVKPQSNRMGLRLEGPQLERRISTELVSKPITMGTIQVPSDGHPIILGADRQTTGGYPQIGHVITADFPILAQLKPGDDVRFQRVSLEEAQRLLVEKEKWLGNMARNIRLKVAFP